MQRKYYLLENISKYLYSNSLGDVYELIDCPGLKFVISSHYLKLMPDNTCCYKRETVYNGFMSYKNSPLYQRIYHLTPFEIEKLLISFYEKVNDYQMTQKYGANWRKLDFLSCNH